ncbi:MAG: M48 family metalloprotease [Leptolyngbyaceae cyanobacterium CSU_1_3]|nr:M48 family metalloprotease [Leptolyngbyaceae cyanobacterium CSU_1_3]
MTFSPDRADQILEAGLAAAKQSNYPEAIQLLERFLVAQAGALHHPGAIKAQMALVVAYGRSGQSKKAAQLCRELNRSENAKVRAWATQALGEIWEKGQRGSAEVEGTGFVPLVEMPQPRGERRSVFIPPTEMNETSAQFLGEPELLSSEEPTQPLDRPVASLAAPLDPPATATSRPQRWQPLKKISPARLQRAEMGTAVVLFLTLCGLWAAIAALPIYWTQFATTVLKWNAYIPPFRIPFLAILLALALLFLLSPWVLDALLKKLYGMKPLSTQTLAHFSPESHRLLQRVCQQQRISLPQLNVLPTETPLSFTYGCHPKFARVVVSQGLLDHLDDNEIAAIYATELGHILSGDFSFMAWVTVVLQLPYTLYWQAAEAGNWLRSKSAARRREVPIVATLLSIAADLLAIVSSLSYGLYWLLRNSGLWLSRQRVEYGDHTAANLTGNPNGLTRALLKIAVGTAQTLQKHRQTDYLIEGFDLLTPLGCLTAIHLGSLYPHGSLRSLLEWDLTHPDRHWLGLNNSHPLMGDRLQRLTSYAHHCQVNPELDLEFATASTPRHRNTLLLQGAPFFGTLLGYVMAQLLWFSAQILYRLGVQQITWLASDYDLFASFMLLGFGLGTFLRFNSFFPDIQGIEASDIATPQTLPEWLANPAALPIDSQPICLEGTLIGRSGIGNWLGQDLILQTATGCIKLHYLSQLGAIGNLLPPRPADFVHHSVVVTGWFRRGATPWIDADTLRTSTGRSLHSGHQAWSTLLAGAAIFVAIVLIL